MTSIVKNLYSSCLICSFVILDSGLPPRLSGSAWRDYFYRWVEDVGCSFSALDCSDLFYIFVKKLIARTFHIHSEPKLAELLLQQKVILF